MAKITSSERKKLPDSDFAIVKIVAAKDDKNKVKIRKFPMDTVARARNAKARAPQSYDAGNITKSEMEKVQRKANKIIKKAGGAPSPVIPASKKPAKKNKK